MNMIIKFLTYCYQSLPVIRELIYIRDCIQRILNALGDIKSIEAFRLFDLELPNHPRYGDPRRLLRYQYQVSSQNGEDGIIQEIFRRVGTTNRIFAEVGVGDGNENNTAFLLSQGWRGFWIDGSNEFVSAVKARRDLRDGCLKWLVSYVSKENAAALFGQLGVPEEFDLLSIDIDQNTYYIWEGLLGFRPRVVVIEYNSSIPAEIDWKVEYDPDRICNGTHNFGASLKALEKLASQRGYSLVGCEFIGANAFFVRDDLVADRFAPPFTSENHHEPPRYCLLSRRGHPTAILDRPRSG